MLKYLRNSVKHKFRILSVLADKNYNIKILRLLENVLSKLDSFYGLISIYTIRGKNAHYCITPTLPARYKHVLKGGNRALTVENV